MARPRHQPTEESRKTVEAASGWGVPLESVAAHIGITPITLMRRYRKEIADGKAKAFLKVSKSAYQRAVGDPANGIQPDSGMLRWWTACQMKWSPAPQQVEVYTPPGQKIVVGDDREDSVAAFLRSQAEAPRVPVPVNGAGVELHRSNGEEPPGDAGPGES